MMDTAEELIRRGYEVLLVVSKDKNLEKTNGIKYISIPFYTQRLSEGPIKPVEFIKCIVKGIINKYADICIYKALKNEGIDLVHINGISSDNGPKFAKRIHQPCVWHIRQLLEEDMNVHLFNEKKMIRWMNMASATIAISRVVQKKFEKKLKNPPVLIYHGVPAGKYATEEHRIFETETTNIILAGRIVEEKGQMDAIRAVEELVHGQDQLAVHLTITGNRRGDYITTIEKYVKDHGLDPWIEVLPHQDLHSMRKKMDIGLICSKCEAFGRVTIEAMMSKELLIGADTGATPELIEDGVTGLLYRQGDYHSLAEKIRYAVTHKEESRLIAECGYREALEKYTIERNVDQLTALYEKVIRENRKKA